MPGRRPALRGHDAANQTQYLRELVADKNRWSHPLTDEERALALARALFFAELPRVSTLQPPNSRVPKNLYLLDF
jgi:hypothetical protein